VSLNDQELNQSIINLFIMKKTILNLGKVLNTTEQNKITGGFDDLDGPYVCGNNPTKIVPKNIICSDGTKPFLAYA